jgi:hypothetical protein
LPASVPLKDLLSDSFGFCAGAIPVDSYFLMAGKLAVIFIQEVLYGRKD